MYMMHVGVHLLYVCLFVLTCFIYFSLFFSRNYKIASKDFFYDMFYDVFILHNNYSII